MTFFSINSKMFDCVNQKLKGIKYLLFDKYKPQLRDSIKLLDKGQLPVDYPRPAFLTGTGACGTHFFAELLGGSSDILSIHETMSDQVLDSFNRYCTWFDLPVDNSPFVAFRRGFIDKAYHEDKLFFEANTYLTFSIKLLHQAFDATVILSMRSPEKTVESYVSRGWYLEPIYREDTDLAVGYQTNYENVNHAFGRIVPLGDEFDRWQKLTQVGKIAWFWNVIHVRALEQMRELPDNRKMVLDLHQFNYEKYKELLSLVGGKDPILPDEFDLIVSGRPGKRKKQKRPYSDWSDREWAEFLQETDHACSELRAYSPDLDYQRERV